MSRRRSVRLVVVGAGMLTAVLAGCGVDDPEDGAATGAEAESAGLPSVPVLDLTTGDEVVLSSYLPGDRPVLVWMWSPY